MAADSVSQIIYQGNVPAFSQIYYTKKAERDLRARREYMAEKKETGSLDETYMIDIMRGRVKISDLLI